MAGSGSDLRMVLCMHKIEQGLTNHYQNWDGIFTVGVVSDTHVPDRVRNLHPHLMTILKETQVDLIVHAGDVCAPKVLEELGEIAPVIAVGGNRDIFFGGKYPLKRQIDIDGIKLGIAHGHDGLLNYILGKFRFIFEGYRLKTLVKLLTNALPEADVIVFGHSHRPENIWIDGKLYFNPGSAGIGSPRFGPSMGILSFHQEKHINGKIISLKGARLKRGKWVEE
jgi:putative phosphoesterase